MIYGTQIFGGLFVLVMIYFTFLYYKRKEFGKIWMVSWMNLWMGALFLIIFPRSVDGILQPLSLTSVTQFLVVGSIMILFGFMLVGSARMKNMEKKLEEVGRGIALGKKK